MFFQLFFKTILLDVLRFPLWWYSHGALDVFRWAWRALQAHEAAIGVRIWIKNLFVPMYGQYDWQGRLISFLFRVLLSFVRVAWLLVWVGIIVALVTLYLAWPIGAVVGLVRVLIV